jgi:hypothetical protein
MYTGVFTRRCFLFVIIVVVVVVVIVVRTFTGWHHVVARVLAVLGRCLFIIDLFEFLRPRTTMIDSPIPRRLCIYQQ